MCTGLELLAAGSLASAGFTAYGAYQQGQAAEKMADYNVALEEVKAQEARSTGAIQETRHRQKVKQIIGTQTAAMGASGLEVGTGSFGKILDETAAMGELDALTIRSNALKQAWGFESQANMDAFEGKLAASKGRTGAVTSLLSYSPNIYKSGHAAGWWKK